MGLVGLVAGGAAATADLAVTGAGLPPVAAGADMVRVSDSESSAAGLESVELFCLTLVLVCSDAVGKR